MPRHDPAVAPDAFVASSAVLEGDVRVGPGCVIDHGALIVSTGTPVELGERVVVMPGAVIRSTGGGDRPPHPVTIGDDCLIGPQAALAGCALGAAVYVATQVMVFHGAAVVTGDLDQARELLAAADFFGTVFAAAPADRAAPADLAELHRRSAAAVAAEIRQRSG
jgi:carbonic anhydrase/acetyltransferase-like protein (isoleucine patch superfamily)